MLTIKELKKETGLHITTNHNGKMDGMQSLSTSPLINSQCNKNCKIDGSICSKCFSRKQMGAFPTMNKPLSENYEILTSRILPVNELPLINALYFRFEAFGDLANDTQVINYFNICKANPYTRFALWTKNPQIVYKAILKGYEKPTNLNIIYSSLFMNQPTKIYIIKRKYPFIDKVFNVFTDEKEAWNYNLEINCGTRKCLKCRICYEKNDITSVNELVK
jgi:hypothetical protein